MILPLWMRITAAIILLSIIGGVLGVIHHIIWKSGYEAGKAEVQALWDKERNVAQAALTKADAATDKNQRDVDTGLFDLSSQFVQGESHAKAVTDRFTHDLRTGAVRLSVPTRTPADRHQAKDGVGPAVAGGTGAETRTELVPAAAADIVAIAADADAAVRQLDKVIDAYNVMRAACNAPMEDVQ